MAYRHVGQHSAIIRTNLGGEFKMTNQNPWLCSAETWASLFLRQKLLTTQKKISWNHNAQKHHWTKTICFTVCKMSFQSKIPRLPRRLPVVLRLHTNMVFTRTWIDEFYSEVKSQEKIDRNHWKSNERSSFRFYRWEWSSFFELRGVRKGST